jgi:hypothetical protein
MSKWANILLAVWVMKSCNTLNEVIDFMNTLPADVAKEAKITTIGSYRAVVGVLSSPYYVFYLSDKPEDISAATDKAKHNAELAKNKTQKGDTTGQ